VSAPSTSPRAIDLLQQAAAFLRPRLERSLPIHERLKTFWAGCVAARDLGATDVVETEFLALASETGITADLGRHAETDLRHVIRMALIGSNPFQ
jgi:hypothetical protein